MRSLTAAAALLLLAGPALAQEAPLHADTSVQPAVQMPSPAASAPTFTADEARKLYELGVKTGMAQAVVQAAQQEAKPILDKLNALKTGAQ